MKLLTCSHCGQRVFFENAHCGACGSALGFVPDELEMRAFQLQDDGSWIRQGSEGPALKPCQNYQLEQVCNWMLPADSSETLCTACRTTHTIPALTKPENRQYWTLLEQAKRRLFYTLLSLKLPTPSKLDDLEHGLSFEFLEEIVPGERVLTGHDEGVITLNIAEADDARREQARAAMHEPYRTLLGHFRHESGHYYWDRLVLDSPWLEECRQLFGDETLDYEEALKKHYANPRADWQNEFISIYASSHPWEDWAECWAHYLHMVDGLDTATAWGLRLDRALPGGAPVQADGLTPENGTVETSLIEQWLPVSQFINAMNRSLGSRDGYPFVVPPAVIQKLAFIHKVVSAAARGDTPMRFASTGAPDNNTDQAAVPPPAEAPLDNSPTEFGQQTMAA